MRILIAALLMTLLLLQLKLWLSDGGLREVWRLERQVAAQTQENDRLADRNAALEAEVMDLKQGLAAAEERARAELGMVGGDETFYQIMPQSAASAFTAEPRPSVEPRPPTTPGSLPPPPAPPPRNPDAPQTSTAPQ